MIRAQRIIQTVQQVTKRPCGLWLLLGAGCFYGQPAVCYKIVRISNQETLLDLECCSVAEAFECLVV
jgi:hypothetical protein